MIVSALSVFLSGSKSTRLLRQGMAGQTVEIVAVSWVGNPCARSSRSIMLRTPPDLGAWLVAGVARASVGRTGKDPSGGGRRRVRDERPLCRGRWPRSFGE